MSVIGCLFSCGSKLPTDNAIKYPYIVKSIETLEGKLCIYNIETGHDYALYIDNISVVDSVGKFVIGDSVRFSLNKR